MHAGRGAVTLGAAPGSSQPLPFNAVQQIAQELDASTGLNVRALTPEETRQQQWRKLAVNAAINAATALVDCRNGELAAQREGRAFMAAVCQEVRKLQKHYSRNCAIRWELHTQSQDSYSRSIHDFQSLQFVLSSRCKVAMGVP